MNEHISPSSSLNTPLSNKRGRVRNMRNMLAGALLMATTGAIANNAIAGATCNVDQNTPIAPYTVDQTTNGEKNIILNTAEQVKKFLNDIQQNKINHVAVTLNSQVENCRDQVSKAINNSLNENIDTVIYLNPEISKKPVSPQPSLHHTDSEGFSGAEKLAGGGLMAVGGMAVGVFIRRKMKKLLQERERTQQTQLWHATELQDSINKYIEKLGVPAQDTQDQSPETAETKPAQEAQDQSSQTAAPFNIEKYANGNDNIIPSFIDRYGRKIAMVIKENATIMAWVDNQPYIVKPTGAKRFFSSPKGQPSEVTWDDFQAFLDTDPNVPNAKEQVIIQIKSHFGETNVVEDGDKLTVNQTFEIRVINAGTFFVHQNGFPLDANGNLDFRQGAIPEQFTWGEFKDILENQKHIQEKTETMYNIDNYFEKNGSVTERDINNFTLDVSFYGENFIIQVTGKNTISIQQYNLLPDKKKKAGELTKVITSTDSTQWSAFQTILDEKQKHIQEKTETMQDIVGYFRNNAIKPNINWGDFTLDVSFYGQNFIIQVHGTNTISIQEYNLLPDRKQAGKFKKVIIPKKPMKWAQFQSILEKRKENIREKTEMMNNIADYFIQQNGSVAKRDTDNFTLDVSFYGEDFTITVNDNNTLSKNSQDEILALPYSEDKFKQIFDGIKETITQNTQAFQNFLTDYFNREVVISNTYSPNIVDFQIHDLKYRATFQKDGNVFLSLHKDVRSAHWNLSELSPIHRGINIFKNKIFGKKIGFEFGTLDFQKKSPPKSFSLGDLQEIIQEMFPPEEELVPPDSLAVELDPPDLPAVEYTVQRMDGSDGPERHEDDDVNPIDEADVYLSHYRYGQAEECIIEAIKQHPERDELKLKLLDIYYTQMKAQEFLEFAQTIAPNYKDSNPVFWEKVSNWARSLFIENPLFMPENHEHDRELGKREIGYDFFEQDKDTTADELPEIHDTKDDNPASRLNFAKACFDLGSKEQARPSLVYVLDNGNNEQQAEARALLAQLDQKE